jgi:hypothetical protein
MKLSEQHKYNCMHGERRGADEGCGEIDGEGVSYLEQ